MMRQLRKNWKFTCLVMTPFAVDSLALMVLPKQQAEKVVVAMQVVVFIGVFWFSLRLIREEVRRRRQAKIMHGLKLAYPADPKPTDRQA